MKVHSEAVRSNYDDNDDYFSLLVSLIRMIMLIMMIMLIISVWWLWRLKEKGAECEAVSLSPPEDASTHNHDDDDDNANQDGDVYSFCTSGELVARCQVAGDQVAGGR